MERLATSKSPDQTSSCRIWSAWGSALWKWDGRWVASYKITAPSHPCRSWSGGIVRSGKLYITAQHIKESLFKGLDELDGGGAEQDDEQAWENK